MAMSAGPASERFYTRSEAIDNGPGFWKYLRVSIFENDGRGERKIGEYIRNLAAFYYTFCPFQQDGQWYALYSKDYTATRVMELPSCRDIAGEEHHTHGFCPVDFYVPFTHERVVAAGHEGRFGFVAGCIWGDDSSWKIQHLDLSRICEGKLLRQEKFGYIAMPDDKRRLADSISLDSYFPPETPVVTIQASIHFNVETGRFESHL